MTDTPDNPSIDAFRQMSEAREQRAQAHALMREGEPYKGAVRQLDRYILDYGIGLNAIELMSTRHPPFFERFISLRIKPHLVQSAIAASTVIKEGLFDPARREMRFLVEASVKSLWLDQGSPDLPDRKKTSRRAPITVHEKVDALDGLGRERFALVVDSLQFGMLDAPGAKAYRQTAKSLFRDLSTTTHVSSRNVRRDLANFDRNKHFALETVTDVNKIARLMRQVLDLALASHFEAFDHDLVGNLLEPPFLPNWSFLKTPLVAAIDRHFDYKHERRVRRGLGSQGEAK